MAGDSMRELGEEAQRVLDARRYYLPVAHDAAFGGPDRATNSVIAGHAAHALYDGRAVLIVPPDRDDLGRGLVEGRYRGLPEGTALIYCGSYSPFGSSGDDRKALERVVYSGKPNKVVSELGGFYIDAVTAADPDAGSG